MQDSNLRTPDSTPNAHRGPHATPIFLRTPFTPEHWQGGAYKTESPRTWEIGSFLEHKLQLILGSGWTSKYHWRFWLKARIRTPVDSSNPAKSNFCSGYTSSNVHPEQHFHRKEFTSSCANFLITEKNEPKMCKPLRHFS